MYMYSLIVFVQHSYTTLEEEIRSTHYIRYMFIAITGRFIYIALSFYFPNTVRLTSTKLFTIPPPTTTTIPSVAYSNVMANGCNMKTSTTNDSSVTITQTTTTTGKHNVSALTNGMLTETSRASTSVMGTISIHNSDAIASNELDQHGELQHASSTGAS